MKSRTRHLWLPLAIISIALLVPAQALAAWPTDPARLQLPAVRQAGADRFATAAAAAAAAYPDWAGVDHVVIASGDDRAAVDPLAASGLCWAYDAPLLLTSRGSTPSSTLAALRAIASVNPTVTVTVVGGTYAVPPARVDELRSALPTASVEQPWTSGDRYQLARQISARISSVAATRGLSRPSAAFVVNGAETARFSDALAASAVSRTTGVPVVLTRGDVATDAAASALWALAPSEVIIVGGEQAVSAATYRALGGTSRWWGQNRYSTAVSVGRESMDRGWSAGTTVGIAAALPDALAGAASLGRSGGILLVTDRSSLSPEVWSQLLSMSQQPECVLFGGPVAISDGVFRELQGAPGRPVMDATTPGAWVGKTMRVAGRAASNTTEVTLYVAGTRIGSQAVVPYGSYDFGLVSSPSKSGTVEVRATNPDGATASATRTVSRLVYPYATCIIIDKSDFRLYWIKDNALVKAYPIAIGREGMETPLRTWRILAKYHSDPASVYGPRKMRLFRQSDSGWLYTSYLIHGTSEPWVIGSKASHGCIRMYNSDVLELFPQVPLGTYVITRN